MKPNLFHMSLYRFPHILSLNSALTLTSFRCLSFGFASQNTIYILLYILFVSPDRGHSAPCISHQARLSLGELLPLLVRG